MDITHITLEKNFAPLYLIEHQPAEDAFGRTVMTFSTMDGLCQI